MKLIFICSPYNGDIKGNTKKAMEYCRQIESEGHAPFSPQLWFPQFMSEQERRQDGISAGIKIMKACDEVHVFGMSKGVAQEAQAAEIMGKPIVWQGDSKVAYRAYLEMINTN